MINNITKYRANGKLLLTGEYLVLKGAEALALPTKPGQEMTVQEIEKPGISWTSAVNGKSWFRADFEHENLAISSASDLEIAQKLQEILLNAKQLNPDFPQDNSLGYDVKTNLEFDRQWGLGSSSSLISVIADWVKCNPFELNKMVFKGSGYDIACAKAEAPILYQLQPDEYHVQQSSFNPPFADQLYFVWLNKKQDTLMEIGRFHKECYFQKPINQVNQLTQAIEETKSFSEFRTLLEEHENVVSKVIQTPKIKDTLFPDFNGTIKSLGAWGGDFVLVASELPEKAIVKYFNKKGFATVVRYEQLIKTLKN